MLPLLNPLSPLGDQALPHPGYVPGAFYGTWGGTVGATGAVGAVDRLYLYPFLIREQVAIASLFLRVTTAGTGSSAKMGLWRSVRGRPRGAPVAADSAGVATASTGVKSAAVSALLLPGWYWAGSKHTGTLPVCLNIPGTTGLGAALIGAAANTDALQNGATNQASALYLAAPYADALPNLDGASFTTLTGATAGVPILGFEVAA